MLAWARISWDLLPETLCRPGALTEARLGPSARETAFQLWGHLRPLRGSRPLAARLPVAPWPQPVPAR